MHRRVWLTLLPVLGLLPLTVAAPPPAPRVALSCQEPTPRLARCRLTGHGFRPHERVIIAYPVVVHLPNNTQQRTTYRQAATTDGHGALSPLVVQFSLPAHYRFYEVTAQVTEVVVKG